VLRALELKGLKVITFKETEEMSEKGNLAAYRTGGTPYWLKLRSIFFGFITNGKQLNVLI